MSPQVVQTPQYVRPEIKFSNGARIGMLGIIFGMLLNFGGLIWGAATISASVEQLQKTQVQIQRTQMDISHQLGRIDIRLTLAESRINDLRDAGGGP